MLYVLIPGVTYKQAQRDAHYNINSKVTIVTEK